MQQRRAPIAFQQRFGSGGGGGHGHSAPQSFTPLPIAPATGGPGLFGIGGIVVCALAAGATSLFLERQAYANIAPPSKNVTTPVAAPSNPARFEPRPVGPLVLPAEYEDMLQKLEANLKTNPGNLTAKYMTRDMFLSFPPEEREILYRCCRTGADNPDSGVGSYIMTPSNLQTYRPFFDKLIRDYHKAGPTDKHVTDWNISDVGEKGVLDVTKLGLGELSMRVRVGRNLKRFNLPGNMTRAERVEFEQTMLKAFDQLKANPAFGGEVYSLTPDFNGQPNPNKITDEQYEKLVKAHVMFKNMDEDPYLKSAGISANWPYGRGCYQSKDKQVIIWFGEEDQLRIMCMKKGTKLNEVFDRLRNVLNTCERIEGIEFAHDPDFGYITSCQPPLWIWI